MIKFGSGISPERRKEIMAEIEATNKRLKLEKKSIFDKPMKGESLEDFEARMLTGKYDV